MTIAEIIEKLEKAEGPDRDLDGAIAINLEGYFVDDDGWYAYTDEVLNTVHSGNGKFLLVKKYTSSIDAAVQLCERVLPAANCWGVDKDERGFEAHVQLNGVKSGHWAKFAEHRSSAPIALCIAILRALQTKEGE